jgi:hypothetical protein
MGFALFVLLTGARDPPRADAGQRPGHGVPERCNQVVRPAGLPVPGEAGSEVRVPRRQQGL